VVVVVVVVSEMLADFPHSPMHPHHHSPSISVCSRPSPPPSGRRSRHRRHEFSSREPKRPPLTAVVKHEHEQRPRGAQTERPGQRQLLAARSSSSSPSMRCCRPAVMVGRRCYMYGQLTPWHFQLFD